MPSDYYGDRGRAARRTIRECPDCGRETAVYRGDVHKYRCTRCIADVIGMTYRPSDPRPRRERVGGQPTGSDYRGRPVLDMPTRQKETR